MYGIYLLSDNFMIYQTNKNIFDVFNILLKPNVIDLLDCNIKKETIKPQSFLSIIENLGNDNIGSPEIINNIRNDLGNFTVYIYV